MKHHKCVVMQLCRHHSLSGEYCICVLLVESTLHLSWCIKRISTCWVCYSEGISYSYSINNNKQVKYIWLLVTTLMPLSLHVEFHKGQSSY